MSTITSQLTSTLAEQRVWMGNVSWSTYLELCEHSECPRGKLTFDQGMLEIMSPSFLHENVSCLIGRMIEMFTFHRRIDIKSAKSTTFKRKNKQKGFEADESYYISNAKKMHGASKVNLKFHPPPDLAIEVDISRSSELKMGVFSGLGVREVWRYDGERLAIQILRDGNYQISPFSEELPEFPIELANWLLTQREQLSENALLQKFMDEIGKSS